MTDERRPGPWDRSANEKVVKLQPKPARPDNPRDARPVDRGQHPAVAIGGTLLFLGFLWLWTGSWVIAVAVIFGLFVHEYGHVLAMNRLGCGPAKVYIIPFLGGLAKSQRLPSSEWDGVLISLAGPLFGLVAAIPFFLLHALDVPLPFPDRIGWLAAVFVIAMLNLINLAPAPPLDGSKAIGPVLHKIHPMLEKGAMLLVGAVVLVWAFTNGSYIFGVFVAIALFGHLNQRIRPHYGRPLSNAESGKSVAAFIGTALACAGVAVGGATLLTGDPVTGLEQVTHWFRFG